MGKMKAIDYGEASPAIIEALETSRKRNKSIRITLKDGRRMSGVVTWTDVDDMRFPLLVADKYALIGDIFFGDEVVNVEAV